MEPVAVRIIEFADPVLAGPEVAARCVAACGHPHHVEFDRSFDERCGWPGAIARPIELGRFGPVDHGHSLRCEPLDGGGEVGECGYGREIEFGVRGDLVDDLGDGDSVWSAARQRDWARVAAVLTERSRRRWQSFLGNRELELLGAKDVENADLLTSASVSGLVPCPELKDVRHGVR